MAKQLTATVILTNPKTRLAETFRPGEPVPGWASRLITNPAAWGEADAAPAPQAAAAPVTPATPSTPASAASADSAANAAAVPPAPPEPSSTPATATSAADPAGDDDEAAVLEEPPRKGRGSSLEAWQGHADALGIEYDNDASRDDIIAAVDARV